MVDYLWNYAALLVVWVAFTVLSALQVESHMRVWKHWVVAGVASGLVVTLFIALGYSH